MRDTQTAASSDRLLLTRRAAPFPLMEPRAHGSRLLFRDTDKRLKQSTFGFPLTCESPAGGVLGDTPVMPYVDDPISSLTPAHPPEFTALSFATAG